MAFSSPCSSFTYRYSYDVFLSFKGSDTRFGFTGNLYKALCDKGINTFIDDRELQGGDEITPSLVKAIGDSRIAIPVFSKNYASSSFCLDELVNIIECFKEKGRLVLPVFYDVDPSQVRHQTGSYAEAIAKHEVRFKNNREKMDRLQKWKMTLSHAANLCGHHFNQGSEYEHKFIRRIVKEVTKKINRTPLHVADYPVGLEWQLLQVYSLLDVGYNNDGVCIIGIYGIGGIGKTTLAPAIYNLIADQFEGLCFLHDVRENSAKLGLKHLQENILSKSIGLNIKLGHVSKGIPIIKQRLQQKKILLILDDVDELEQLQDLIGEPDWLGPGSRAIITTRDRHLLVCHGIERTYEVNGLNETNALELLRWKAFKNNKVDASYEYILNDVVTYASGLPLALEVVGSNLFGKHIEEWKSMLDQYKRIPNKKIQRILKVSFDSLEENEQSVFLDVACCFKRYDLAEVEDILCAHYGHCIKYHIGVLVEKSLIKISEWSYVTLHDLIEDMGKEIVRQESLKEPAKRSRLWFHEDIIEVLKENTGTRQTEIIYLDFPQFDKVVEWKGDEFKKMKNLKTLIVKNGRFSKGPNYLPESLRVLEWRKFPSSNIPSEFYCEKLSICKLGESCFTNFELHGLLKRFINVTELNLDNCKCLIQLLDVSSLSNLEKFSFRHCENLTTIHNSIGFLPKLKILRADSCSKLKSFPPLELTSLQRLELSFCDSLKSFPEILGEMKNISEIVLEGTSIEEFSFSFQNLTGLRKLHIWGNGLLRLSSSILMMSKLSYVLAEDCILFPKQNDIASYVESSCVDNLRLPNCNLTNEFLQIGLTWFSNVRHLDLSRNTFTIIPECIKECCFLITLNLNDCKYLQEIRGIPSSIKRLSALHCESLTSTCRSMLLNQELHEDGNTDFCLPGIAKVPDWFQHKSLGPSISFWFRNKLPSISLFVVSKLMQCKFPNNGFLPLSAVNLIINGCKFDIRCPPDGGIRLMMSLDHTYLTEMQLQEMEIKSKLNEELIRGEWIHAEVTFEHQMKNALFIGSGIHVSKKNISMEDVQFMDPYKRRKLDDGDDKYSH